MAVTLTSLQRKYLRGLAHSLKPVVFVGQKGVGGNVFSALEAAFDKHELIKVKFIEFKEKDEKKALIEVIEKETHSQLCGLIGHVAIFYRRQKDPKKRNISLPE